MYTNKCTWKRGELPVLAVSFLTQPLLVFSFYDTDCSVIKSRNKEYNFGILGRRYTVVKILSKTLKNESFLTNLKNSCTVFYKRFKNESECIASVNCMLHDRYNLVQSRSIKVFSLRPKIVINGKFLLYLVVFMSFLFVKMEHSNISIVKSKTPLL